MDTARYLVAFLVVVTIPPVGLFWFLVHPFANYWRKIKPRWTYGFLFSLFIALIFTLYPFRNSLIGIDYGFQPILAIIGVICYVISIRIYLERRKDLTNSIMLGYPEVSINGYPGKLLTDGIYGKIQHPRYVEIQLGFIDYALITNFQGVYIMTIILILNLYLIVLLKEKDLIN